MVQSAVSTVRSVVPPVLATAWTVLASVWTYFSWYYQEVIVPSAAPVNLTTEIKVEEVGSGDVTGKPSKNHLEAILLTVTVNNVSTRDVYFLQNYWAAWGREIEPQQFTIQHDGWLELINQQSARIQEESPEGVPRERTYAESGKHYTTASNVLVAWGNAFPDTYMLYPKETVSRSYIFYVPTGTYDLVHVEVHIPTMKEKDAAEMTYTVSPKYIQPRLFKVEQGGARKELTNTSEISASGVQDTVSWRQMSLWQSELKRKAPKSPSVAARG